MIIYVEESIINHPNTQKMLAKYGPDYIEIKHYKDVFNQKKANYYLDKENPAIILAKQTNNFYYKGSSNCINYGYDNFYYTTLVANCLYDCAYCYLKGLYDRGYVVVFVNMEDYLEALSKLVTDKKIYLSISYEGELLAFEDTLGYAKELSLWALNYPNLIMECRTKGFANHPIINTPNFIYGYTISPPEQINALERTLSFTKRLEQLKVLLDNKANVNLCIDPIIAEYAKYLPPLVDKLANAIPLANLWGLTIGFFRVSKDGLGVLRKQEIQEFYYPFILKDNTYSYPKEITDKYLVEIIEKLIRSGLKHEKIFY